jgi:hypothetical protein
LIVSGGAWQFCGLSADRGWHSAARRDGRAGRHPQIRLRQRRGSDLIDGPHYGVVHDQRSDCRAGSSGEVSAVDAGNPGLPPPEGETRACWLVLGSNCRRLEARVCQSRKGRLSMIDERHRRWTEFLRTHCGLTKINFGAGELLPLSRVRVIRASYLRRSMQSAVAAPPRRGHTA